MYQTRSATRINGREEAEIIDAALTAPLDQVEAALHKVQQESHGTSFEERESSFWATLKRTLESRLAGQPVTQMPSRAQSAVGPDSAIIIVDADYRDERRSINVLRRGNLNEELQHMRQILKRANEVGATVFEVAVPGVFETEPSIAALRGPRWVRVNKSRDSAFDGTNLIDEIQGRQIKHVVLVGKNENWCILATAKDAVSAGLSVETSPMLTQTGPGVLPAQNETLTQFMDAHGSLIADFRQLEFMRKSVLRGIDPSVLTRATSR